MISQTITDLDSTARQCKLLEYVEREADQHEAAMHALTEQGLYALASENMRRATLCRGVAVRCRKQIMAATQPQQPAGLADICAEHQEPPCRLVEFTAWLVARLARWLPWASSEDWQQAAYVLLRRRPGGLP